MWPTKCDGSTLVHMLSKIATIKYSTLLFIKRAQLVKIIKKSHHYLLRKKALKTNISLKKSR